MMYRHSQQLIIQQNKYGNLTDDIMGLYAGLEAIASDEQSENGFNSVKQDFIKFFTYSENIRQKCQQLIENDILQGIITKKHLRKYKPLMATIEDRPINGDTLLLRAMSIDAEKGSDQEKILTKIITEILVKNCPELIVYPKNSDNYQGITPLHLAIIKERKDILIEMFDALKDIDKERFSDENLKNICAEGTIFQDTVMMAGTPLGVAALKFNEDIFNCVLRNFDFTLDVTNENCDNIIHSLVEYAYLHPNELTKVLKMVSYVIGCKFLRDDEFHTEKKNAKKNIQKLLMMTNKDRLNPLQLAVKKQQFKIFELIMENKVYHTKDTRDGFFIDEEYDITEIETIQLTFEETHKKEDDSSTKHDHHESILEYIVHQETNNAFHFVDFLPVKEVIRAKWKAYSWFFLSWFAVHLVLMVVLSVAAVYRSILETTVSTNSTVKFSYVVTHDTFVSVVSVVGLVFALLYLAMEISRIMISRFSHRVSSNLLKRVFRNFGSPYSNQVFRIYFVLFSLFLMLDCVLAATEASGSFSGYENYCLIFAVIIGWYLVMFFLKTFKAFSIFTVLIQRAIVDLLKFALVMAFFLVAFSVAMYMIMQGAETEEDDFILFNTTMFKMLTIMIGIGDLEILFRARHPYLAVFVFVLFVLLTTILLLNALIAMMSNTCTDLMSNYGGEIAAKLHCRLQKLSIILFLEGFLPRYLCKEVGEKDTKDRYDNNTNKWKHDTIRRLWRRNSMHSHRRRNESYKAMHSLGTDSQNDGASSMLKQGLHTNNKVFPLKKIIKRHNETLDTLTFDITSYDCDMFETEDKGTNIPEAQ